MGKFPEALAEYDNTSTIDPTDDDAYLNKGAILYYLVFVSLMLVIQSLLQHLL